MSQSNGAIRIAAKGLQKFEFERPGSEDVITIEIDVVAVQDHRAVQEREFFGADGKLLPDKYKDLMDSRENFLKALLADSARFLPKERQAAFQETVDRLTRTQVRSFFFNLDRKREELRGFFEEVSGNGQSPQASSEVVFSE